MFLADSSVAVWEGVCSCTFWWDLLHSRKERDTSLSRLHGVRGQQRERRESGVTEQHERAHGLDVACKICHRPSVQSERSGSPRPCPPVGRGWDESNQWKWWGFCVASVRMEKTHQHKHNQQKPPQLISAKVNSSMKAASGMIHEELLPGMTCLSIH